MANRYWVGGNANWDATAGTKWALTSGGAGGQAVPTSADDVFLDNGTGTGNVTIAANAVCRSLDCTGYTGTLTYDTNVRTLSIGTTTPGANNIALKFVAGMTYTILGTANSILFTSTSSTQQSITWGGQAVGNINVTGNGGKWQFQDAANITGTLTYSNSGGGVLDTNGKNVTCVTYTGTGVTVGTLTMGSTAWTISSGWTARSSTTVTANTATITQTGAASPFDANSIGGTNYHGTSLIQSGSGIATIGLSGNNNAITLANYTRTCTGAKTDGVAFAYDTTITGTMTFNGGSVQGVNRLIVSSAPRGTQRTINCTGAAVVISSDVDFMDINITGSPSWTNTGSSWVGDAGGNGSLITSNRTTPADQTATGTASITWSTHGWTSRVPLPQDNVFIPNAFIAGRTVTFDMPRSGADIDFTGCTGSPTIFGAAGVPTEMYGSLTLVSGLQPAATNALTFAGRGTHTLTPAGRTFTQSLAFNGPGGTYTEQGAFLSGRGAGTALTVTAGTFNDNGQTFTFTATASGVTVNGGTLTMTGSWNLGAVNPVTVWSYTSGTVNGSGSTITITAATGSSRTFAGGGQTYGSLVYNVANSAGPLIVSGSNTWTGTTPFDIGSGRAVTFTSGTTQTFTNGQPTLVGQTNPYLYLPGVSGNYVSAPDSAALDLTGDMTLIFDGALDDWTPTSALFLAAKWTGGTIIATSSYRFYVNSVDGKLNFTTCDGVATTNAVSSVAPTVADGARLAVKVEWRASDGRVQFFTAPTISGSWTQLGTNQTNTRVPQNSTALFSTGADSGGTVNFAACKIYRVQAHSGLQSGGASTAVFDADYTNRDITTSNWLDAAKTQFAEGSSNAATVTINGLAAQSGDGRVILNSSVAASAATLAITPDVSAQYVSVKDSTVTGSGRYVIYRGTNVSGNTGWIFGDFPIASTLNTRVTSIPLMRSSVF